MRVFKTIRDVDLVKKHILLRAGWDVPLENGAVVDDTRIRQTMPTIQYLFDHAIEHLTIIFHVGRPHGKVVTELSTKPVVDRFQELSAGKFDFKKITTRENLRFDPREEQNNQAFAKELAKNQDIYVNDAFSNCHRNHASMVAITSELLAYAGFLVEKEVKNLSYLLEKPQRPFVVLIGGAKIEDKLPVIDRLVNVADLILVGGKTGIELNINRAREHEKIMPLVDDIEGFDIGSKTLELFKKELAKAKTIFWNGNMGKSEIAKYEMGTLEIARFLSHVNAKVFIGGGDTGKVITDMGLESKMAFVSTGGGATLEFLTSGGDLVGLRPLYKT